MAQDSYYHQTLLCPHLYRPVYTSAARIRLLHSKGTPCSEPNEDKQRWTLFYVIDARCSIAVKGRTFNGKLHHHLVGNAYILPGRVYECVCVYVNSGIYVLCLCSMEEMETLLFVVQPCVVELRINLVTFAELQVVILAWFHRVYCNTTLPRLTIAVPLRRKALISSICQSLNHVDCH